MPHQFQSAPAPKDGRYVVRHTMMHDNLEFQSAPAPKDGRYDLRFATATTK